MGPFCAQPNRSSYTASDVVGGSEDDCVMADKRAKKNISVLLQQLTYEIIDKIYFLQEPRKSASAVALLQNQL